MQTPSDAISGLAMRVEKESAFILHQRAYSETSTIFDIFSQNFGRFSLIAKGIKKQNSSKGSVLQQFQPLLLSWAGKSELKTLTAAEPDSDILAMIPGSMYCGFYINELVIRLLHQHDPHPELFIYYKKTLKQLSQGVSEKVLRLFEKYLLIEIGYGVILDHDINNNKIDETKDYYYVPESGPVEVGEKKSDAVKIQGKSLVAFANEKLDDKDVLADIKKLMRVLVQIQLGDKSLHSRKLMNNFISLSR